MELFYSIDQLIYPPPFSALISILLILGCDFFGLAFMCGLGFCDASNKAWVRWQAPLIGSMLLAFFLYPLALVNLVPRLLMQIVALIFMAAGCIRVCAILRSGISSEIIHSFRIEEVLKWPLSKMLVILVLIGYGLLSLGPATSADSLDYHLGAAIALINEGGMPLNLEWFSGRLAGSGEVLNALGLSVGAEQFGSLLQFSSLLGIAGILFFSPNINRSPCISRESDGGRYFLVLAAITSPVLLFLVSSAKPQLWPIAMTTFAFKLMLDLHENSKLRKDIYSNYAFICWLVMSAYLAKFNYLLGGGIVGIAAFLRMINRKYFLAAFLIGLIFSIILIGPSIAWKAISYDATLVDALMHPLPGHLPGTDIAIARQQFNADVSSRFPFPISILIPGGIGAFGVVLGVSWVLLIGLRPDRNTALWNGLIVAFIVIAVNVRFAPPAARMYLEPYFWLFLVLAIQPSSRKIYDQAWLKCVVYSQTTLVILSLIFGIATLFPGALLTEWRIKIMERSANGYEIMRWVDQIIPNDAVLLNGHRSVALTPRKSVTTGWIEYVDTESTDADLYLNLLKWKRVSHALVLGPIVSSTPLVKCFGRVVDGPQVGHISTRNPFNQGSAYEAWIVEFESNRLPDCARQNYIYKPGNDVKAE